MKLYFGRVICKTCGEELASKDALKNHDIDIHLMSYIDTDKVSIIDASVITIGLGLKPGSQPHAHFFDRTFFSLIPIFWNRICFY